MTHHPVELTNVIFNPASQAFEARARVHDPAGSRSYACAVMAPITTEYDRAAELLTDMALRRHGGAARALDFSLPQSRVHPNRSAFQRLSRRVFTSFLGRPAAA